ncbi:putative (Uracil-5)-methyltransferase family [Helianthus annuus]|nr:putative (Uracil-5)-methyltransferase family [Helianthus annuus]
MDGVNEPVENGKISNLLDPDAVLAAVQDCWRNPELGLSPYDCHSHTGFLKHLTIRSGRDVETREPQLMVNFVTSSYKPEL